MFRRMRLNRTTAFEEIALPHVDALYNFALKMTRNERDAEDLVQDTYLRAFRFFHRFQKGTNIRAWLFRILKNVYINGYRRMKASPDMVEWDQVEEFYDSVVPGDLVQPRPTPEDQIIDRTVDRRVEEAIAALPEEYRAVVLLNFVEEFSYKQIAEILDIPIGTVMSRLHRGRHILQARLKEYARSTGVLRSLPREHLSPAEAFRRRRGRIVPLLASPCRGNC